ncbi:hypothetical protein F5B22DRAFT_96303 [Xylaria bambusicola]|uniref:uncharacterized protein n=1 Tax=Xylaria bambusicola TaxID=326684 RepID=UPI0020085476|nr:uncharacterized protein F5B22DRAFT_96303 [Xylaria bambusicola]KAI0517721.1 hypothetical protein F5B22DRAFT_96303 [Xylaria bambusicola]
MRQRGESAEKIEVWKLDMSEYDSIMAFTKRADALARLDIVILNAGVRKGTEVFNASTGYEESIQVNFLSSFLLLVQLLPIIKAKRQNSEPGRITLVSSDSARMALLEERNESPILPAFKRNRAVFNSGEQYYVQQVEGARATCDEPSSVANINMATPGFCRGTGIMRELYSPLVAFVADNVTRLFGRSATVGARVIVNGCLKDIETKAVQTPHDHTPLCVQQEPCRC